MLWLRMGSTEVRLACPMGSEGFGAVGARDAPRFVEPPFLELTLGSFVCREKMEACWGKRNREAVLAPEISFCRSSVVF